MTTNLRSEAITPNQLQLLCPELNDWRERTPKDASIAIIGLGKMGILHAGILNLLRPRTITTIVEKSRILSYAMSRTVKQIKVLNDVDDLQDREVTAAYVTTPAKSHHYLLSRLLAIGIPSIFVEKPPTENLEQLNQLLTAKKPNQVIMTGLQKRFALPFRHAKSLLSQRLLGEIRGVRAHAKSSDILSPTARFDSLGKGCLLDIGIHVVDILTYLFEITSVLQSSQRKIHTKVDDAFHAELRTLDNIPVILDVTWSDSAYRLPETRVEVDGDWGTLTVTEDFVKVTAKQNRIENMAVYKPHYYRSLPPVCVADPEYALEDLHFLQSIAASTKPITSLDSVRTTVRLIDQIYEMAGVTSG